MADTSVPAEDDIAWIAPGQHGTPAQAITRIRTIAQAVPDLYGALFAVLGVHQGLPREILAAAVHPCRAELAALRREDVVALLTAIWNGGREGFEAVMRSRKKGERKPALGWVKD